MRKFRDYLGYVSYLIDQGKNTSLRGDIYQWVTDTRGWRGKYSGPGIRNTFGERSREGMIMRSNDFYTDLFVLLTNAT